MQKCTIEFRGFNYKIVEANVNKVKDFLSQFSFINLKGPIFMPIKKKRFTLLRSPHNHKVSQEHFEMFNYKCLIVVSTKHLPVLMKILNFLKQNLFLNLECKFSTKLYYKY